MAARENRHGQRVMAAQGIPEIAAAVTQRYGLIVQSGPFKGMKYIDESAGSAFLPKIIGSYECELAGVLQKVLTQPTIPW